MYMQLLSCYILLSLLLEGFYWEPDSQTLGWGGLGMGHWRPALLCFQPETSIIGGGNREGRERDVLVRGSEDRSYHPIPRLGNKEGGEWEEEAEEGSDMMRGGQYPIGQLYQISHLERKGKHK